MEQCPENLNELNTSPGQARNTSYLSSLAERIQDTHVIRRRLLILFGFPMAWFFANYYLESPRGFHQALFWPIFLCVMFWFFRPEIRYKDPVVILSGLGVLAGSVHAAVYASAPLSALNFIALPLLSVFGLIAATRTSPEVTLRSFLSTLDTLLIKPFLSLVLTMPFLTTSKQQRPEDAQTDKSMLREVIIGLVLAIPLVFFLLTLLTKADFGFAGSVDGFLNGFLLDFSLRDIMGQLLGSLIALLYFIGVVIGVKLNRGQQPIRLNNGSFQPATVSVIILWSIDILYALFTLTQLRTLYFPKETLNAMNQGIAQYARSGFFSLLMVLAINFLLLWYLSTFTRPSDKLKPVMKTGYLFMILFTVNLIASSFYKMSLYESEYGYTFLRLFVKAALIFSCFALLIMVLYLLGKTKELIKPVTLLLITLYIGLSLVNLEGLIAAKAAEIYETRRHLDIEYLSGLTADALPALRRSFQFDTTEDPRVLELKSKYTSHLLTSLSCSQQKEHPLSATITELKVCP